jgi:hypothetical protein
LPFTHKDTRGLQNGEMITTAHLLHSVALNNGSELLNPILHGLPWSPEPFGDGSGVAVMLHEQLPEFSHFR